MFFFLQLPSLDWHGGQASLPQCSFFQGVGFVRRDLIVGPSVSSTLIAPVVFPLRSPSSIFWMFFLSWLLGVWGTYRVPSTSGCLEGFFLEFFLLAGFDFVLSPVGLNQDVLPHSFFYLLVFLPDFYDPFTFLVPSTSDPHILSHRLPLASVP